jgi:hypothetical protein
MITLRPWHRCYSSRFDPRYKRIMAAFLAAGSAVQRDTLNA